MKFPNLIHGALAVLLLTAAVHAQPLRVCATVPDLGDLARQVGGDEVDVTVFARGMEDAHFIEARPGFVKALNQADLYVQMGLELEVGWAPVLLRNARNGRVLPGAPGYLDASQVIAPLEAPTGPVDRSMGDVHAAGNPHYLLDPLNGLKVAALIRDRLAALRPDAREGFHRRYDDFAVKLAEKMVGTPLTQKYGIEGVEKLALLFTHGKLNDYLQQQGEAALLGGWFAALAPYHNLPVVDDHNLWTYFVHRFGLRTIAHLEPKPGIAPTTRHLTRVTEDANAAGVRVILTSSYFNRRHADVVARHTGAAVLRMAHQVGSRDGAEDYLSLFDYNVTELLRALQHSSETTNPERNQG